MAYEVPQETLERTKNCPFAFACQKPGQWAPCTVVSHVNRQVLFVNPREKGICPYFSLFGLDYICGCPTRAEIYSRYKV